MGDRFYIIIEGLVSVEVPDPDYVPTPPPEPEEEIPLVAAAKTLPKRSMTLAAFRRSNTNNRDSIGNNSPLGRD